MKAVKLFSVFVMVHVLILCGVFQTLAFGKNRNLVVALSGQILSLDPHRSAGSPSATVRLHMYETLVYADEHNRIYPWLAEKWTVADDGLTWTFHLKKGVKFHDGTPMNAQAVVKSFDRLMDESMGSNRRYLYTDFDEIKALDEYTVQVRTKVRKANFLHLMAYGGASVISPAAMEKWGSDLINHPVGTGPYMMESKLTGEFVQLVPFNDYWGGKPKLDGIRFVSVKEEATRVTMLENGEADFIVNVPPQDLARLENNFEISVRRDPSNRVAHIGLNITQKPFDNQKVRQAMNYAVNRALIVKGVLGGIGEPAQSILAPATWGFAPVSPYKYDKEKALSLLREAGYPDGFKGKLWTPSGRYFRDKETALAVAGELKKIGIDLEVEVIDWGQYLKLLRVGKDQGNKVPAYMLGWESVTGETNYLMNAVFASKNHPPKGWNTMFYTNPRVDELTRISAQTLDENTRKAQFREFQELVIDDAPWIPLYVYQQVSAYRSDLTGITILPMEVPLFTRAYITHVAD